MGNDSLTIQFQLLHESAKRHNHLYRVRCNLFTPVFSHRQGAIQSFHSEIQSLSLFLFFLCSFFTFPRTWFTFFTHATIFMFHHLFSFVCTTTLVLSRRRKKIDPKKSFRTIFFLLHLEHLRMHPHQSCDLLTESHPSGSSLSLKKARCFAAFTIESRLGLSLAIVDESEMRLSCFLR